MLKKAIYTALVLLMGLFLLNPTATFAVEGVEQTDDELMYITGEPETDTSEVEDATTYYEDYDWESAWNDLEDSQTNTTYDDLTDEEAAALGVFGLVFGGAMLVFAIVAGLINYVYFSLTLMVTAKKLNMPKAWMAWVPIAQFFLLNNAAGLNTWLTLLWLVPGVNMFYVVYVYVMLSERRGFNKWLGLLVLVPVISLIYMGYLAWGEVKKVA